MAEIAISVAAKVSEYLVAPITVPFRYMWNYKSYLEHLKKEVENLDGTRNSVQHSVEDARRKGEEIEKHVQSWLPRAENIIREASELVNEDNHQQANLQCFRGFSCPNLKKRYQLSKKAAGKLKDVVGLKQTAAEFKQVSYRTIPEQTCLQPIKGHQDFESRNSILKDVINALSTSDINMVGIYGMGGVGKTTLAKQVATQAKRDRLFDKTIFVEVSESPDIKNIQGVIADNLGLQFTEETTSGRANRLCDRLKKEEKILLILDNIWRSIDFETVGIPFENDRKGLKLLLTTRNRNVLTNMVDSQLNFPIQTLNDEDAWSLFKSITGMRVEQPDLESVARQVAKECGGMPVAIVTVAKALKNKGQDEWNNALRKLKNPSSESFEGMTKEVYTSIQLSYDYLETKELKEIFLLCSRMGRTYDASIRDLFSYGWGLGLFEKFNTMEEALCNVYTSVNELKATSLLLDALESEEFDTDDTPPNNERFAMHDVICDFARKIASRDQHVFTVIDDVIPRSWAKKNTLRECTSITLHNFDELPKDLPLVCSALKFLYMKPKESSFRIPDNFFAGMSGLKVLHLVEMDLQTLPTSLNCLVNDLNVLCLDQCKLGDTTVIGDLNKLEILSFRDSDVEELSEQMRQLTKLRLLDLSDCSELSVIPPNVLSSLTKLEALYMGNTCIDWEVERPNIERSNVSFNELKHLCHLTLLEIHIPDAKMSKGLLSSELKRYKIFIGDEWDEEHWRIHSKTHRMLKLSLDTNEDGIISQLHGIEELELGEVVGARNLLDDLNRNGFPTLKHLHVHSISHCLDSFSCGALPLLESLIVEQMEGLEKICNRPLGAESFGQLRTIEVLFCHKLNNIFSFSTVTALPQLQEINVCNCENMEEIFAIGEQDDGSNNEVIHDIKFSQLRDLSLVRLPRLNSFCRKVKTASPFQSTSDTNAREIISDEEFDIPTLLFDNKVVSPNLEVLEVYEIPVERIWHNLLPPMSSCVQNLTELIVFDCGNLKELFSSSTRRDTISFPKLNYLELREHAKLMRLWSGYSIEFPSLKTFMISGCPKLKEFIFDDKIRVPNLEVMEIEYMGNLKMIWHNQLDWDSFRKLKSLKVNGCRKLLTLFPSKNMCERLLSLESLEVTSCDSLEEIFNLQGIIPEEGNSLAATIQSRELSFSNLQNLSVTSCESLKNLFANEGVSAQEVPVRFCFPKLTSLELMKLPKLRNFYPGKHKVKCPVLKKLKQSLLLKEVVSPNLEDLEVRNFHVERIWHNSLPTMSSCVQNLTRLTIEDCDNLKELFPSSLVITEGSREEERRNKISFPKLKYLWLRNLAKLTGLSSGYYIEFPSLETFVISSCPEFEEFIFDDKVVSPNLKVLEVRYIHVERIWHNLLPTMSSCVQNLTRLSIVGCGNLKVLFPSSMVIADGSRKEERRDTISFPKLNYLKLRNLAQLTRLWSGYYIEFLSLKTFKISRCLELEIFIFDDKVRAPDLEEMEIMYMHKLKMIWHNQLDGDSFRKLKSLQVEYCHELLTLFQSNMCERLLSLESLSVSKCRTLMNLMPHSASFQNLTFLEVDGCGSLENVVTSSTAKSLVKLTQMDISNCKNITEVVGNQGDVTDDQIIFSSLKYLLLENLRGLTTFCYSSCTLEFPYLEELNVSDCRNLKISQEKLITQRLQEVNINDKLIKLCSDNDLYTAIQQFHEKEISTSDDDAASSDDAQISTSDDDAASSDDAQISTSDDDASSSDDVE